MPQSTLEYEEEDLFGSDDDSNTNINTALPTSTAGISLNTRTSIVPSTTQAGPSRTPIIPLGSRNTDSAGGQSHGKGKSAAYEAQGRLTELRGKKRQNAIIEEWAGQGVGSLRGACMSVIRANSSRIWDVGDMEYPMIRPFIDSLPQDQLLEIEETSPQIKKDTDWLWEVFLLEDYPLFHERCRERKGELRTSGWRRMYKKAKEDAEERQSQAKSRMAERYRQLEEEKASKKIVVMDKAIEPMKKRPRGAGWGKGGTSGKSSWASSAASSGSKNPTAIALAKARQDAQRARVALTHASGKYIPLANSSRPRPRGETNELFKNPYLEHSSTPKSQVTGPRLPPPRRALTATRTPSTPDHSSTLPYTRTQSPYQPSSPVSSPIHGAYPTHLHNQRRTALPDHLVPTSNHRPNTAVAGQSPAERLRLPDKARKQVATITKPDVQNFEPPKVTDPRAKIDFFADALATKTKKHDEEGSSDLAKGTDKQLSAPNPFFAPPQSNQSFNATMTNLSGEVKDKDMSSVLFRKKSKPKQPVGR